MNARSVVRLTLCLPQISLPSATQNADAVAFRQPSCLPVHSRFPREFVGFVACSGPSSVSASRHNNGTVAAARDLSISAGNSVLGVPG